jgi:small subunit ribosomal protein S16
MAVKIRLARHGSKGNPFYRIVVADARSPRDGAFIERIGSYDPQAEPSAITVDEQKARDWLGKGAQPTDQVRNLLKISGVL